MTITFVIHLSEARFRVESHLYEDDYFPSYDLKLIRDNKDAIYTSKDLDKWHAEIFKYFEEIHACARVIVSGRLIRNAGFPDGVFFNVSVY